MKVTLIDGPYKDVEVEISGSGGLFVDGQLPDGTPVTGRRAYYRPTRKRSEYRFKHWVGEEEILVVPRVGERS